MRALSKFKQKELNKAQRSRFIKSDLYDTYVCKAYYTFYMTIRRTNLPIDIEKGLNPDHYILVTSVPEFYSGFETAELAMKKGYQRSKELFNQRLKSKPNHG